MARLPPPKRRGLSRLWHATQYSIDGLRAGWHEPAFRQELLLGVLLLPAAWLLARPGPTALWYVSDHGESLGEGGVYLHGMPYALAPREQTHVPMLVWANDAMRERLGLSWECLQRRAVKPASHDDVFHTLLGVWDIRTQDYRPERDLLRACRS